MTATLLALGCQLLPWDGHFPTLLLINCLSLATVACPRYPGLLCLVCGSVTGGVWCAGQVLHGARDGAVALAATHYCQL